MASVAESSIASVPLAHLMQLQERLLQGPQANVATTQQGDAAAPENHDNDVSADAPTSIPETADATATPLNAPPRMGMSKSANAAEMEAMVNASPSQEAFVAMTRASSFHGYPGGDTQPMESQVYRDFDASVIFPTPVKALPPTPIFGETYEDESVAADHTAKTCVEGDTGYIDLEHAMPSPGAQSASSFAEGFETSPQIELPAFSVPKTPALAGHKRRHSGELLTSATTAPRYPAFSQLFGGAQTTAMLSATQAFNQTQAPSSPMPDGPHSDPIVTRPSPNLNQHFPTSSPIMTMSSPVATMRPSTAGEPRDRYTSMRESQERRAARFRAEFGVPHDFDDGNVDEEDDGFGPVRVRVDSTRVHRTRSDQTLFEHAKLRAAPRPDPRLASSPKPAPTIDLTTPAAAKRDESEEFMVSEDGSDNEDALPEDEALGNDIPSDDEYDELSQAILRSQGVGDNDEVEEDLQSVIENDNPRHDVTDDVTADRHDSERPRTITQHSAIADSQPLRQEQQQKSSNRHFKEQSSDSSFVPGSQYAGRTSQDQARLLSRQTAFTPSDDAPQHVPSSPLLPVATDAGAMEIDETAMDVEETNRNFEVATEVPESDFPVSDNVFCEPIKAPAVNDAKQTHSNNQFPFSTAQTHFSEAMQSPKKAGTAMSPIKILESQQSKPASQSPLTAAGARRFAEIAAAASQSPVKGSAGSEINVDAIMNDVMTADDTEFLQAISSPPDGPPTKRRKVTNANSNKAAESRPTEINARDTAEDTRDESPREKVAANRGVNFQPATEATNVASSRALLESPSKANERPMSTQDSVKDREKAGADAVSQLLSTRPQYRLPRKKRGHPLRTRDERKQAVARYEAIKAADIPKLDDSGAVQDTSAAADESEEVSHLTITSPLRVFALFKGQYNKYYSATWLGPCLGSAHRVRFDDTTVASVEAHQICRLELQVNDQLKVDLPEMRNKTWLVKGFASAAEKNLNQASDIYGRSMLKVQAKSGRGSVSTGTAALEAEGEVVDIPLSSIYLTVTMWSHFKDRLFVPPPGSATTDRPSTPSTELQTPDLTTPPSRSRRATVTAAKDVSRATSNLREAPVSSGSSSSKAGLFSGMAFAISYVSNQEQKTNVTRQILDNGGIIVESGFDELFDLRSMDEPSTTLDDHEGSKPRCEESGLVLKPEYEKLGFVALIADRHSRRAKYMQALALGIPTLSGRWITDSMDAKRNTSIPGLEASPLPWAKYLLSAGESSYLGGATRSRGMSEYPAKQALISTTIANRNVLLHGDGVLIVVPTKGKAAWDRRKAYAFLTLALGAGRVKRVSDLHQARTISTDEAGRWKWIYVDGSVTEANATIFGRAGAGAKKRKREGDGPKRDANATSTSNEQVKVVDDEFVVQSLILGALVD